MEDRQDEWVRRAESSLNLTPDGSGRRGGEGREGLGEKSSALKHTLELSVPGGQGEGGCPPKGFTPTLPRYREVLNAPTPAK